MLLKVSKAFFRIRIKKNEPFITEIEFENQKKLEKAFRKQNIDLYWEIQTKVENDFIGKLKRQVRRIPKTNRLKKTPETAGQHRQILILGPEYHYRTARQRKTQITSLRKVRCQRNSQKTKQSAAVKSARRRKQILAQQS